MREADNFLRAIRDTPEDDAPRLVFADWLEEHGQPERAEFIRVQCELARPDTPPARRRRLAVRERELLAAGRSAWLGGLGDSPVPWVFHRGFVERLGDGGFFRNGPVQYRDETWWEHFRFFPDGLVLTDVWDCPRRRYSVRRAARRLDRGNRARPRGTYTLRVERGRAAIRFTIDEHSASDYPAVRYRGTIEGPRLTVSGRDRDEYHWVALRRRAGGSTRKRDR